MTRWIWILALAACGTSDDGGGGGGGGGALACNAVSYCSTWSANDVDITPPTERGGTIADGIYRLERGTFNIELFQFAGNHVNAITDSFQNDSGTYTTADGMISFSYLQTCNSEGTMDSTSSWKNRPYYVNGDTLLIGMADSGNGAVIWYEYKKLSIDQICTEDANVKCGVSNCSCAVVTNGFGTVESGVKSCSSQ